MDFGLGLRVEGAHREGLYFSNVVPGSLLDVVSWRHLVPTLCKFKLRHISIPCKPHPC